MDREQIVKWMNDLMIPASRGTALYELCKIRESIPDLAPMLWQNVGQMACVLQEIGRIHFSFDPATLTADLSLRVSSALALLQCVASHPQTRSAFLATNLPLLVYPVLQMDQNTVEVEHCRLAALGVIGALVMTNDREVIPFLLSTSFLPLCLHMMESGSELSTTLATYIIDYILLDDEGLWYMCHTLERFMYLVTALRQTVVRLANEPSVRLFKHVVRCYLRLADNPIACEALRYFLPDELLGDTFIESLREAPSIQLAVARLREKLYQPE